MAALVAICMVASTIAATLAILGVGSAVLEASVSSRVTVDYSADQVARKIPRLSPEIIDAIRRDRDGSDSDSGTPGGPTSQTPPPGSVPTPGPSGGATPPPNTGGPATPTPLLPLPTPLPTMPVATPTPPSLPTLPPTPTPPVIPTLPALPTLLPTPTLPPLP
ncbi:MAG: hypothetical protein E6I02_03360 [Chloroflexi bacterium]|nr:MAG: hypothetical protein E6I02_03360 [Chloroflexota bacterium]